jgi:hypothetical protein
MGKYSNASNAFGGNLEENRPLGRPIIYGRIILKGVLKKQNSMA